MDEPTLRLAIIFQRNAQAGERVRIENLHGLSRVSFYSTASVFRVGIEALLQAAATLPKNELPDHFECISKEMQALQKFVSDSATFLSSYDLRSSQQVILFLSLPPPPLPLSNFIPFLLSCLYSTYTN